jgi:hypothetical protein
MLMVQYFEKEKKKRNFAGLTNQYLKHEKLQLHEQHFIMSICM